MTWEEAVIFFRTQHENSQMVIDAYLDEDLVQNIERFIKSDEWLETIKELSKLISEKNQISILDIGAGNGIASISFALHEFHVTALEPDNSNTVGSGAIKHLANHYNLKNISVIEAFGESLPFADKSFDIVYGRQVMHHASDLNSFVNEASRVLKKGGVFMSTRDHVIKNEKDKKKFLLRHPIQKLYGGENAFKLEEYEEAIQKAGLEVIKLLSPSQSVINYSPWSKKKISTIICKKFGKYLNFKLLIDLLWKINLKRLELLPGKLYSFIAIKQ